MKQLNFLPARAAVFAVVLSVFTQIAAAAGVTAYEGRLLLPTYPWSPPVRHPYFKETDGRNIYPYPMMDNLSRESRVQAWRTVVLENEYLRVTFLPELGGRIYEVWDKPANKPVFYVNHVVKPGLIGQCGAWISGGIEFNTGPQGHTVSAVLPVHVAILPEAPDGSRSVAVGEVERIYRTRWTVTVTLRPGRSFLEETVRISNPTEIVRPYYFWNCTAVPNTPGFRFIYPMTLGSDHDAKKFFRWPVDGGRDLSLAWNYKDASSIFAYECDQDFFGGYDEQSGRGVVACADHRVLPGKKAWTWGTGGFGAMHQMDLTDKDGPYNEIQTGPLPTQADVGRLDPGESISWQEWWYPIHDIGGFTFANTNLAVNAALQDGRLRLRMIGTGSWKQCNVSVRHDDRIVAASVCSISPAKPADLSLEAPVSSGPLQVEITAGTLKLAAFPVPLELPVRNPPKPRPAPKTAAELARAGWSHFLFGRFGEAKTNFMKALGMDGSLSDAHAGIAYASLELDTSSAAEAARKAVAADPDNGLGRLALAVAELRLGMDEDALADAWRAANDPLTVTSARALIGKILLRRGQYPAVISTLSAPGPWNGDSVCRNRLAYALLQADRHNAAIELARASLMADPLDIFARSILWLAKAETGPLRLRHLLIGNAHAALDLAVEYSELGQKETALRILEEFCMGKGGTPVSDPIPSYWAAWLAKQLGRDSISQFHLSAAARMPVEGVFPHHHETVAVLRWALEQNPRDGRAALCLGHLLFALGRHAEGRTFWQKAADLGESPAVAWRALGQAARALDGDLAKAAGHLERAHQADAKDPIIARDLARVLLLLADKQQSYRQALLQQARQALQDAYQAGRGRSDFVALLARVQNLLGDYTATARMLDQVRITVWEGAREAHDLFEEAHLALGKALLEAGQPSEALKEFERALEYPANLATGRLENTCDAHIHWLRGNALAAMGRKQDAMKAWQQAVNEPASKDAQKEEARRKAKAALDAAVEK